MKSEHKKWADLVVSGKSEMDAYLQVYPNASKKTAGNQLGNFRKNWELMEYLNTKLQKIASNAEAIATDKLSDVQLKSVMSANEKRSILLKIATGEIEVEKMVLVRDTNKDSETYNKLVWKKMLVKPDLAERMKAIDLDNKMSGEFFRAKPHELGGGEEESAEDIFKNTTFVFRSADDGK